MKQLLSHWIKVWLGALLCLIAAVANAADPDFAKALVYNVKGMADVVRTRDITYKTEDTTNLQMDVYSPQKLRKGASLPAVIFIHGGLVAKDLLLPTEWGIYKSYGQLSAASGFVGVTFNHRLYGQNDYGRSFSDIKAAIEYVRSHATELHVDPNRIALWFFSAAGPHFSSVLREKPKGLRCVVSFYSLLDLRPFLPANADANVTAAVEKLSAAAQVKDHHEGLPMFIARAGLDSPQINQGIDPFVAEALSANATIEVMNHPKGLHGFDSLNDDARSREIVAAAVKFLQVHLSDN